MNKIFKHKFLAGAMLLASVFAGSSCEDNVGINVTPETPFADKTLYEVLVNDPELTDFVEILNACGPECADSLFNHSRVYTLWAPVNSEKFNKDSIIDEIVNKGNRDVVFREFIESHIANHLVAANGELDSENTVLLLNDKNATFTGDYNNGYTFSGVKLQEKNIRVRNGILHKIAAVSEYKYSIWEYLKVAADVDSVAQYLYSYNVTKFNEGLSIKGPLVQGQQTFLDSAFTTSNIWLDSWSGVGNIDSEDSTYIVYVPNNELWSKMVAKAEKHFNYDTAQYKTDAIRIERDSLRRYYARLHNLKYMTYSVNEQSHVKAADSMMPAYRNGKRPLFKTAELEKNVTFEKELSNGTFKVVAEMPYKQTDLWHDTIFLEGENQAMWNYGATVPDEVEVLTAYKSQLNKDSMLLGAEVSGGAYFSASKSGASTAMFKIPKVLSAKYHVAVIVVPKNITSDLVKKEDMYPNRFDIVMSQNLGAADPETGNFSIELYAAKYVKPKGNEEVSPDDKSLQTNPFKVDTLFFTTNGEKAVIEPRYCEFYNGAAKDYNVTLQISSTTATNKEKRAGKNFDTAIRIDKILLIPVLDSEE